MELVLNNFSEISFEDCISIDGGFSWGTLVTGIGEIIGGTAAIIIPGAGTVGGAVSVYCGVMTLSYLFNL